MPRWFRLSATAAALALSLPLLVCLAAYGWLQTEPGRHWFAARVGTLSGGQVEIAGLSGGLPFRLIADRVAIVDADGPWLVAEKVAIALDGHALLELVLRIETASAERMTVLRLPQKQPAKGGGGRLSVPAIPVPVSLAELAVPRLTLASPVLGQEAHFAVAGSGSLGPEGASLQLALDRSDAPGHASARVRYDRLGDRLTLDAAIDEPSGLLARKLAEKAAPLTLHAAGDGPLSAWHGTLALTAGDARLDLDLTATGTGPRALALTGRADPRPLMPRPLADLLSARTTLAADVIVGDRFILRRLHAESGANRLAFDGTVDLGDFSGSGRAELALPDAAILAPVLATPVGGGLVLTADLTAGTDGQAAKLQASGTNLLLDRVRVGSATLIGTASRPARNGPVRIDAVLEAQGVASAGAAPAPALPPELRLDLTGTLSADFQSLKAERLRVAGAGAELAWTGTAAVDGALDGRLEAKVPDIARFALWPALHLRGGIAADLALSAPAHPSRLQVTLDARLTEPSSGIAAVDALLGPAATVAAVGAVDSAGAITVDRLSLEGASTLSGSGRIDIPANTVEARYALDLADAARLGAALGQALAGSAHLDGTVEGSVADPSVTAELSSPALTVADLDLREVRARIAATSVTSQPKGTVEATLGLFGQPATLDTGFALARPRLALPDLKARVGRASAAGGLTLDLGNGALQGRLALDAPDLGPWSRLAGTTLAGSVRGTVTLTPAGGLEADLTGTGIGVGASRIGQISATARLQSWRSERRGTVTADLKQVEVGRVKMSSALLKLEPQGDTLPFSATAGGTAGAPFDLTVRGTVAPAKRRVGLAALDGRFAGRPLHLDGGTAIAFGQGLTVDPFTLRWGDARIAGTLAIGSHLSGKLETTALPLGVFGALAGLDGLSGTGRATVAFSGTTAAPAARLDATLADVRVDEGQTTSPVGTVTLAGTLGRDGLDWQANLAGGEAGLTLAGSGRLPVLWTEPPFGIAYQPDRAMTAKIAGSGQLGPVVALAGADEDRASGRFTVDLTVTGTPTDPIVAGTGRLAGGQYENFASGAVLRELTLDAVGERDRLRLTMSAKDGNGGQVSGTGVLELSGTTLAVLKLDARLERFWVMRTDEIEARASGVLTLKGSLDALALSGAVRMDQVTINVPEKSSVRVPKLDVVEVNGSAPAAKPKTETPAAAGASPAIEVALALDAELPSVAINGQGLRSQWRGKLRVGGTSVNPVITGGLKLVRGTYTVVGKTLPLSEGQISFDGHPGFDAALRVVAQQRVENVTARATLSGTLSSPLLDLSSEPPLPPDEVLSRLLFERPAGELGPGQAIQLADAAASLSGTGSSSLLDTVQKNLGVDRVDVSSTRTVDPKTGKATETTALTVGKDITENVHVGVAQGAAAGTGAVNVGVDLNRHLSVQSTVGQQGSGKIGLRWQYDY